MAEELAAQVEDEAEDEPLEYRYSITSYGADYPVDGLIKRLREDSVFIPPFQRKFVWRQPQASRFVESLLIGLPVPGIFLAKEPDSNRLLVIDGQQRLHTLLAFYKGTFGTKAFTLTGIKSQFAGLSYETLTDEDRRRLDDSIIHATVVRQDHPSDDDTSIYLIFERLNTGGTLLSGQEIRACVSHGPFNDLLGELNERESWRSIYGQEDRRLKDRELILRFFTLYFDLENYERPMKEALNRYMQKNRRLELQDAKRLEAAFGPTIDIIETILEREAFRPVRNLNAAVYDAVMVGVARRLERSGDVDPERFKDRYRKLLVDPDFEGAYSRATSDGERVRERILRATEAFAEI